MDQKTFLNATPTKKALMLAQSAVSKLKSTRNDDVLAEALGAVTDLCEQLVGHTGADKPAKKKT